MGPFMNALKYRNEGGAITPLGAQTGIPQGGNAAPAIQNYLQGTGQAAAGGPMSSSYVPGEVAQGQKERIAAQQSIRGLQDQGVITQDYARQLATETADANLTPQEWANLNNHKGFEKYTGDYTGFDSPIPGLMSSGANAIGNYQLGIQKKHAADGTGITYNVNGQPVTVHQSPITGGLVVTGTTGGVPEHLLFEQARKDGLGTAPNSPTAKVESAIGGVTQAVRNATGQSDRAAERAVATHGHDAQVARGYSSPHEDGRFGGGSSGGGGGGGNWTNSGGGHFYNTGGQIDDPWAPKNVARTNVQTAPLGTASVATPAGMPSGGPGIKQQLGALAAKTLTNNMLGGGFLGQAAGIIGGFNTGGFVPLGGNQSPDALKQALAMGALTRDEYLKAMAHAGQYKNKGGAIHPDQRADMKMHAAHLLNMGGEVPKGPLASVTFTSKDGEKMERKYHNTMNNTHKPQGGSKDKGGE